MTFLGRNELEHVWGVRLIAYAQGLDPPDITLYECCLRVSRLRKSLCVFRVAINVSKGAILVG
jgi:hypothetical protein